MSIKDLKYLKELSWYTTVPLFVCAWIMQDFIVIQSELTSVLGFVKIVSIYFAKVVIGLLFAFVIWLIAAVNLDKVSFPFTLLLATFLLTLAGTGLAIYIIKPGHLNLPVNISARV